MKEFRPGLPGLGSIGRRHLRNLRALGVGKIVGFEPDRDMNIMYVDEMRRSIDAVTKRGGAICPVAEGAEDLRIAFAAFRSQELGRSAPVDEIGFAP